MFKSASHLCVSGEIGSVIMTKLFPLKYLKCFCLLGNSALSDIRNSQVSKISERGGREGYSGVYIAVEFLIVIHTDG